MSLELTVKCLPKARILRSQMISYRCAEMGVPKPPSDADSNFVVISMSTDQ